MSDGRGWKRSCEIGDVSVTSTAHALSASLLHFASSPSPPLLHSFSLSFSPFLPFSSSTDFQSLCRPHSSHYLCSFLNLVSVFIVITVILLILSLSSLFQSFLDSIVFLHVKWSFSRSQSITSFSIISPFPSFLFPLMVLLQESPAPPAFYMNARLKEYNLNLDIRQVPDAITCIFHSLLLHRSTAKFHYKTETNFQLGSLGIKEVECEFIDLCYV
ncbi:hypothetical protein PENTCL1PPCAC_18240, partial [Pristionchus entomophagus]